MLIIWDSQRWRKCGPYRQRRKWVWTVKLHIACGLVCYSTDKSTDKGQQVAKGGEWKLHKDYKLVDVRGKSIFNERSYFNKAQRGGKKIIFQEWQWIEIGWIVKGIEWGSVGKAGCVRAACPENSSGSQSQRVTCGSYRVFYTTWRYSCQEGGAGTYVVYPLCPECCPGACLSITSFNSPNKNMQSTMLFLFYNWRNWCKDRLNNLPESHGG